MHPFEQYLKQHNLEAIRVSIEAQVRYVTVWNAMKGNPVTIDHAQKIRQGVFKLTGVPYTGPLATIQEQVDQLPALLVKKITKPQPTH